jgi:hypothetical protein
MTFLQPFLKRKGSQLDTERDPSAKPLSPPSPLRSLLTTIGRKETPFPSGFTAPICIKYMKQQIYRRLHMKITHLSGLAFAGIVALAAGSLQAQTAGQDIKDAGHDTAHATSTAAHDTANGTKKVYHKTAHGTSVAAHDTAHGTKTAAHNTAHGTSVAAHDTAHGTKVAAHDTAHGTKVAADKTADVSKEGYHKTVNGTESLGHKIEGKPAEPKTPQQ